MYLININCIWHNWSLPASFRNCCVCSLNFMLFLFSVPHILRFRENLFASIWCKSVNILNRFRDFKLCFHHWQMSKYFGVFIISGSRMELFRSSGEKAYLYLHYGQPLFVIIVSVHDILTDCRLENLWGKFTRSLHVDRLSKISLISRSDTLRYSKLSSLF
jgi:hypothetical protein